jgi:hypothetical protein
MTSCRPRRLTVRGDEHNGWGGGAMGPILLAGWLARQHGSKMANEPAIVAAWFTW